MCKLLILQKMFAYKSENKPHGSRFSILLKLKCK